MRLKLLILAVCLSRAVHAQVGAGADWRHFGGDLGSTRYSSLSQIDSDNVGSLEIAWRWKADNFGATPEHKYSVTPIAVNDVLYATAGYRRAVVAIDARSGETLWMHRFDEGERGERAPRKNSGRGVSYWTDDAGDERIFVITPGYHLISLDAKTGRPIPSFGHDGIVDLKTGLDRPVDPIEGIIGSSSPPVVVGNVLVVGAALQTGLRPPSRANVPGHVRGYDVRTGERLWIFHTIPQPHEPGFETWQDSAWTFTGNSAVWSPFSADEELGYVYLPVEAPTSDYYGGLRPGDNLFSSSLVALDAKNGKRVWHYQIVHHDIYDYDNPTAPILADVTVEGVNKRVVVQLTTPAFAYVFDRVTGEPIWPIVERPVPASDVPGEITSTTQPFPTKPPAFDRQGITIDDLVDFTPDLRQGAIRIASEYRLGRFFAPASLIDAPDGKRGTLSLPGNLGGANWEGGALDPETGVLFVASITDPDVLALESDPDVSDLPYVLARSSLTGPQGLPLVKPPWGRITAIDLNAGDRLWMVPNGDTPESVRNHPALEDVDLPRTGKATRSGLLVTPTLLFGGEGWRGDAVFRAYDKATGSIVAEIDLPASQTGLPMTYLAAGKQYIVMAVGSPDTPAELVALTLPR